MGGYGAVNIARAIQLPYRAIPKLFTAAVWKPFSTESSTMTRPTPTALRVLRGNPGKRPMNKREPKPLRGLPRTPAHLSPRAKAAWKSIGGELDRMGVMTAADATALELLSTAYADYRAAHDVITKEGQTYESISTYGTLRRQRPEVAIASEAWRQIASMLREFGLTPSSRTKVATTGGADESDNPFAEFVARP